MKYLLLTSLIFIRAIFPETYLLPLGRLAPASILLSKITVSSSKKIEIKLFSWNPTTKEMAPLLSSLYHPFFVQPLPDGQAFSFLDEGRLRIKQLGKRSPQTISLDDKQLIESATYTWIDDQNYLLCAWHYHPSYEENKIVSKKGTYGIYHAQREGNVTSIVTSPFYDALLPICINNTLFYIRRAVQSISCALICVNLNNITKQELILEENHGAEFDHIIALAEDDLVSFLMENDTYHAIRSRKTEGRWLSEELFQLHARGVGYQDPLHFFTPIIAENQFLIFLDLYDLKSYNLATAEIRTIAQGNEELMICSPCYVEGILYCGCNVTLHNNRAWTKHHTTEYCDLITFKLDGDHFIPLSTSPE
jgi:hypothetical protein